MKRKNHLLILFTALLFFNINGIPHIDDTNQYFNRKDSSNTINILSDSPIIISSNNDFVLQGWKGNGTLENPFIIKGIDSYLRSRPLIEPQRRTVKNLIFKITHWIEKGGRYKLTPEAYQHDNNPTAEHMNEIISILEL
jgi:hypothetical protein